MKTFETEKHSIPEGATHYSNEDDESYFLWLHQDSGGNLWALIEGERVITTAEPIPQQEAKMNIDKLATQVEEVEWKNGDKQMLLAPENANEWVVPNAYDDVSNPIEIPQTNIETPEEKEAEWVNGDGLPPVGAECEVYCPVNPTLPDGDKDWMNTEVVAIIDCGFGAETTVVYKTGWSAQWYVDAHPSNVLKFRKPETEAERVERERLEAAIELHDLAQDAYFACDGGRDGSATWDKSPERVKSMYFAIVDKTNYRKESN